MPLITSAVISAVAGGVFPLVTAGLQAFVESKKDARKSQESAAERAHELELQKLVIASRKGEAETEVETLILHGENKALTMSYDHAIQSGNNSHKWANTVVTMVRPVMTFFLGVLVAYSIAKLLDGQEQAEAVKELMSSFMFVLTWWFGDRSYRRAIMSNK